MTVIHTPTSLDFPAGPWRSHWIWADGAPGGRHVVALSTEFELDDVAATVPARWCAVSRAAVFVNGQEVARGPVRSNPRRQPYDDVDLAPFLRVGTNHVAVQALTYAGTTPWYLPMPPFANDLANGAFVFEADLGDRWLISDSSWTGAVLDGWGSTPGRGVSGRGIEVLDTRSLPADWATGVWDTTVVQRLAHTVGEAGRSTPPTYPLGPFGPRPISSIVPADRPLTPYDEAAFVTDRVVAGTIVIDVEGPAGAEATVRIAEMTDDDGRPAPSDHDAAVRVVCDGTRRTVESLDLYGGQGVVTQADDGVVIHSVTVRERLYPVHGEASFRCSDPGLERIHAVGRRSVTLNSTDAYTDCPTREQRAWTGDSVVHQMVDLTTNEDWLLARRNVAMIADSKRPDGMLPMAVASDAEDADFTVIPDWALHWVHAVWNLHRYVGDPAEVASLLPTVEGVLRWFEPFLGDDGLLRDVYGWVIIDWSSVSNRGACTALNGLWGRALLEFAEMAEWLGDANRASWAASRHAALTDGFERLWDPTRQRYVDAIVGADATGPDERGHASEHAQAAAIVGGVVPTDRLDRLADVLLDPAGRVFATWSQPDGPAEPNAGLEVGGAYLRTGHPEPWWDVDGLVVAQPFFSYVVHDALVLAGRAETIVDRCRAWEIALDRCDTSWTETWFGGTISHGWSSTPTRDLVQRVLGVTPAEPGFTAATIAPALGDLAWAAGVVPTPHGPIRLRVDAASIEIDSPVPLRHGGVEFPAGAHRLERGAP